MPARPEHLVQHLRRLAAPSGASSDTDAVLLDRFLVCRDEESFAALVRRHGPMVQGVCRRILGNVHDAEDAFQAAFLVLARKAASVKPRHALAAWLYGVARRVALKTRGVNIRRMSGNRPIITPPADPHASPLDDLSGRELLAIFEEELQRLPPAYRLPLILCCLEGRSQEEGARQLGWTPGSIKGRLERGRARLHGRLMRRGIGLAAALMAVEAARAGANQVRLGSPGLLARLALRFAHGQAEGTAAVLAEGAMRGMAWSKAILLAGMLTMAMAFAGAGVVGFHAFAGKPLADKANTKPIEQPRAASSHVDHPNDPLPPHAIARLGTTRFRGVRGSLAFSPDGKWLAAATGDLGEHVTIGDMATGREIRRIVGNAFIRRLAFSSEGKRLACSTASGKCRVVAVGSGKELFAVKGFFGHFSDDGKTLLTAGSSENRFRIHVWDAATGRLLREWSASGQGIEALSLATQSPTLALRDNSPLPTIEIHDVRKGKMIRSFKVAWGGTPKLALAADGKTLATADTNGVRLWNTADGKMTAHWNHHVLSQAVFSPDGKRVAWVGYGEDRSASSSHLWIAEREGGKPKAVGTPINTFGPLCFAPDGKRLAVVTDAHVVSLRDIASGKEVLVSEGHNAPVIEVAFAKEGGPIISQDRREIFVWEALTGRLLRRQTVASTDGEGLLFRLSEGRLVTIQQRRNEKGRKDEDIYRVREMRTGREVVRFAGWPGGGPRVAAPSGRFLALRGVAGDLRVLDLQTRQQWSLLKSTEAGYGLKLSADGNVAVWYDNLNKPLEVRVHRHDTAKTFVLRDMPKTDRWHWIFENLLCLSPDGRWLVLNAEDGRLRRWDLTTGKEVSPLTEALRTAWEIVWSPDGRFVAVRGSSSPANSKGDFEARRDVRVWDVRTGKRLAHLTVPNRNGGLHMRFTHDGRTLVTTDLQGMIYLWEVETGKIRLTLKGHLAGEIGALAASADDRLLVSGGYDAQGFVWDLTGLMPDGQWRPVRHSPEKLRAAWKALASDDAKIAYAAMWQLTADPQDSTAFLKEHVKPVPRPKPGQIAQLVVALDADEFTNRQRATHELESLEESAADALRQTLKGKPTLEVRRRIEALLARLDRIPAGETLRALRAIEALEHLGTAEADKVLRQLAEGAPAARLTREAAAASVRLGK